MKYSWYLVLISALVLIVGTGASPDPDSNQLWAQTCNSNNNNKRGVVVSTNDTLVPLSGNWATTSSSCSPTPTQTSSTTTSTGTEAPWTAPTPTYQPATCASQKPNTWSWSDYLYHTYGYGITPALGVMGGLLMLIGLHLMSFGFRIFRGTLAIVGFTVFGIITWIGLTNGEPAGGYPHREIVYITVIVGLGLLGAVLFMFFWFIGIYLIGGLCGFLLSIFVLSWKENLVIENNIARICFIIGMVFLFSASIYLAERYVILFSLAFSGAYMFIFGLDLFVHAGFVNAARLILDHNGCHFIAYRINTGIYVMLAMVIVLTLISFGWQYYWNIMAMHRSFGVNVVPVKAETVIVEKVSSAGSAVAPTEVIVEKGPSSHHSAVIVEKAPTSHHTEEVIVVPSHHSSHSHHSAPLSVIRENASAIASGAVLVKGSSHHTSHHTPVVVASGPRSVIESIAPSTHHTVVSPSRHSVPIIEGSRSIISPSRHSGGILSGGLLSGAANVIPILAGSASRHSVAPTNTRSARGTMLPVPFAPGSRYTGSRSVSGSGSGEVLVVPSAHSRSGNGSGSHHTSHHSSHHTSHHSIAPSAISRSTAAASAVQSGVKSQATAKSASGSRKSTQPEPDTQSVSSTTAHTEPPRQPPIRKLFGIIPL